MATLGRYQESVRNIAGLLMDYVRRKNGGTWKPLKQFKLSGNVTSMFSGKLKTTGVQWPKMVNKHGVHMVQHGVDMM